MIDARSQYHVLSFFFSSSVRDILEFWICSFCTFDITRAFMSYASALLAMCLSRSPLSLKGMGSRIGIIIHPDGLHFTKGYEMESKRSLIMKLMEMGFG
jgi:hypothetical protein